MAAPPCSSVSPGARRRSVYNAVALLDGGRIEAVRYKYNLPNYGVFDEKRVFAPGPLPQPIAFRGVKLGVADLRGYLERGGVRVSCSCGRRASDRPQRLPLLDRQAGGPLRHRQVARRRDPAASRLCQPGGGPGRARLRRRLVRAERRWDGGGTAAGLGGSARCDRMAARGRTVALRARRTRRNRAGRGRQLPRLRHRTTRLCR